MSKIYTIYIFSCTSPEKTQAVACYLNSKTQPSAITGTLDHNHCMATDGGFYIKDMRIIKNRDISQMIMVDIYIHYFGLQINNGIPLLEFFGDVDDRELRGLPNFL